MDNTTQQNFRNWNVLNWNVRRLNDVDKWNAVKAKIDESNCSVFCFQETKKELIDHSFIKKFAPRRFNKFAYVPSDGASGGILVGWVGSQFDGQVIHSKKFALTVHFTSTLNR